MTAGGVVDALGTELIWLVIAVGFGFVMSMVLAVLSMLGRPVPAAALPAGLGVGAVALVGLGRLAVAGWGDLDPDGLRLATTTFGALPVLGLFVLGPVAASTWGVLAYAGARHQPRRVEFAAAGAVLVLLTAAFAVTSGFAGVNWLFAVLRGVGYAGLGSMVVVALLGGGQDGPEAGAGAALGFPLLVAVGEAAERGLAHLLMVPITGSVHPTLWPLAVEQMLEKLSPELPWSYAAVGAASAVAVVGVVLSAREGRGAGAAAGLVWPALAFAVLWAADLGPERLEALSVLCNPDAPTEIPAAD